MRLGILRCLRKKLKRVNPRLNFIRHCSLHLCHSSIYWRRWIPQRQRLSGCRRSISPAPGQGTRRWDAPLLITAESRIWGRSFVLGYKHIEGYRLRRFLRKIILVGLQMNNIISTSQLRQPVVSTIFLCRLQESNCEALFIIVSFMFLWRSTPFCHFNLVVVSPS